MTTEEIMRLTRGRIGAPGAWKRVTATLVDSDVLIDLVGADSPWTGWSSEALTLALEDGAAFVNPVVYAEISVGFEAVEDCEWALSVRGIERIPVPWPAAFLAGRAFLDYRRRGGRKPSPLPDFFIGAHAAVEGLVCSRAMPGAIAPTSPRSS
jgi:predicted nucleic acid-binding protein